MSQINVNTIKNKSGSGAPNFPSGATVTGVVTATSFTGNLTGNVTGGVTGDVVGDLTGDVTGNVTGTASLASGLTGIPSIEVQDVVGIGATFTGNVSIGGTLTYEDVKNIDSVGIVTARNGVRTNVSPAITIRNGTTEKGYIGYNSNDPFIGRKDGVGLSFQNNKIRPVDGDDGSPSTNTVDLGEPTYKFLDGYFAGTLTAGSLAGDGSSLTGVISGVEVKSGGSSVGTSITAINFQSGATVTASTASGISTITISAGLEKESITVTNGNTGTLDLAKQDHKVTATGTVTITTSGGTEGDSHDIRIINSGAANIGFSTNFLWPSGAAPNLPTADGAISLISFTVNKVGVGTQLLSGASLNYS